jgi:hypothetical protein
VCGRLLYVRTVEETMAAGRLLYRMLGIDFQGDARGEVPRRGRSPRRWPSGYSTREEGERGEVTIARCYFSSYYSPQVCRLMSAMDQGLFAGLSGGGRLIFMTRITEGYDHCQAQFTAWEHIR